MIDKPIYRQIPLTTKVWAALASATLVIFASGCASTKYVNEGEMLLSRIYVTQDTTEVAPPLKSSQLINHIGQRPNKKLFGIFDWSLGVYNLNNIHSRSWLNRRLRRWGDPPVIFSEPEAISSAASLSSVLYNKGYLQVKTTYKVDTLSSKRVAVHYHVERGKRFSIGRYEEHIEQREIDSLLHPKDTLRLSKRYPRESYTPLIKEGSPLSAELMQEERKRQMQILRNRGYWGVAEQSIYFDVDTLSEDGSDGGAWVRLHIDSLRQPYRIGNVSLSQPIDKTIHPNILKQRIWIKPGHLYSEEDSRRTYSALSSLGAIGNVTIRYQVDSTAISPTLNCAISTTTNPSKELIMDLTGTHSSGNLGANTSVALVHNNLFGAAEYIKLLGRIGYERLRNANKDHLNYGFEASLSLPKILLPIAYRGENLINGTTDFSLSYDFQTRPEFNRDIFSGSWGYSWSHYGYPAIRYSLKALEIDFMHFGFINPIFQDNLPSITRALNYRDQFVVSTSFMTNYLSTQDYRFRHSPFVHNLRFFAQSAGNLLYGLSSLIQDEPDKLGSYTLLNINYAQFVKAELDYSGLYRIVGKNALAYHAGLAVVYPYGNSRILPIDLRYFSGGGNSLRGWNARELGPGAMPHEFGQNIFQQVGDIKLDLSTELRTRISPSWELALFIDAGNIWTLYPYENQPQGVFRWSSFYKQIALSSGMGFRWDLDLFLLRFDLGIKLHDPQAPLGRRWVMGHYSPRELFTLHFALGYPF